MSVNHHLEKKLTVGTREVLSAEDFAGEAALSIPELSVPHESVDMLVVCALDVSQLSSIFILATCDMTLKTNSGADPDEELSLLAGKPYEWQTGSYFTNLLATDITALYLSNDSGAAGTLTLEAVYDATPALS